MHNPTDGMVHWHEHAMELLTEAVAKRIVAPGAPVPPELLSRSTTTWFERKLDLFLGARFMALYGLTLL
jgi:hypothetical protein